MSSKDILYSLLDDEQKAAVTPGLDAVDQALMAQDTPAQAAPAPVPGPQDTGAYSDEQRDALRQQVYAGALGPSGVSGSSKDRLLNAAPAWYEGGKPPSKLAGNITDAIGGAMAQGAQKQADYLMSLPQRRPSLKLQDANRGALNAAAAGVLSALVNRKSNDYAAQQDAALKEAQMQKLAGDRFASGGDRALAALRYDEGVQQHQAAARAAAEKAEMARREADPNSEESKQAVALAVKSMPLQVKPEDVGKMSLKDLKLMRTALMQGQHEQQSASEFDRRGDRKLAEDIGGEERAQQARIEQEQREAKDKLASQELPGYKRISGRAAPPAVYEKAAATKAAGERIARNASRLKEIQGELNDANLMSAALGGSTVGGVDVGIALAPEKEAKLLAEAKELEHQLITDSRAADNLGVLQKYELDLERSYNPKAGTLQGFFAGAPQWDAIADKARYVTDTNLRAWGWGKEGEQFPDQPLDAPAASQVTRHAKPVVRNARGQEVSLPGVSDLGSPQAPAAQPQTGGAVGIFSVKTSQGTSAPRPMTQAQIDRVIQQYGQDALIRMQ